MNDVKDKSIVYFPHFLPTPILAGVKYTFNNVNGGVKPIGAFGFISNNCLGGQCLIFGLIKELGFWGCQDRHKRDELRAFYLEDPEMVTELGKQLIAKTYPDMKLQYEKYENRTITDEKKEVLKKDAAKFGYTPDLIDNARVETLETMIKAAKFEKKQEDEPKPVKKPAKKPDITNGSTTTKIRI
jgi:hypothetical protein